MDPMMAASAGMQAIGSLFSGILGFNAGNAQSDALKAAAMQANKEAGVQAQVALQQGDQVAARAAVQGAANGGGFTGSTLGIISQLGQQSMFNARAAVYRGSTQAQNDLYEAKVARRNATNQLIGGTIGAVSPIFSQFGKSNAQNQIANSVSERTGDASGWASQAYGSQGAPSDLDGLY